MDDNQLVIEAKTKVEELNQLFGKLYERGINVEIKEETVQMRTIGNRHGGEPRLTHLYATFSKVL